MKPIAIFYHCIFSGGSAPIDTEHACRIVAEQMAALCSSGLAAAAEQFYIGINGRPEDRDLARLFAPAKALYLLHGPNATTEIPTLANLRSWALVHPGYHVLYLHTKGVTHPGEVAYEVWRRRMERAVVTNWRTCISDLESGCDACGSHWLTPEQFPNVTSPFFGGTFWWAKADYLKTLPQLPAATWSNRFEAESWIGRGNPKPRVKDYYPGWP